jgi:hypothetical protein
MIPHLGGLSLDVVVEVAVHELNGNQRSSGEDHVVAVGNVVAQTLYMIQRGAFRRDIQREKMKTL